MAVETKSKLSLEIQKSIKDLLKFQKETDRRINKLITEAEKDRKAAVARTARAEKSSKKTDLQIQKTDLQIKQMIAEGEKDRKAAQKRMNELDKLFTDHWGKLMESLVKGDLLKLLQERGIDVDDIAKEREKTFQGKKYEFDIIAIDGREMVVVEVKTTLRLKDINHFEAKLKLFKEIFPIYKNLKVYGAVAYLKANEGSSERAIKKGFFVIRATGSSASIINAKNFKPTAF